MCTTSIPNSFNGDNNMFHYGQIGGKYIIKVCFGGLVKKVYGSKLDACVKAMVFVVYYVTLLAYVSKTSFKIRATLKHSESCYDDCLGVLAIASHYFCVWIPAVVVSSQMVYDVCCFCFRSALAIFFFVALFDKEPSVF